MGNLKSEACRHADSASVRPTSDPSLIRPSPATWPTHAAENVTLPCLAVNSRMACICGSVRGGIWHIPSMSLEGGNDGKDSLCPGIDRGHNPDWVFAGDGKRICLGNGNRSQGESSEDAGSIAESGRTCETIRGHLLPGRRGFFRAGRVCREVSSYKCSLHRCRSTAWSNFGLV